uniref:40S ribosomal protein S8 n=1 Tax=Gorilla gorilla gorilla TaxID=9595 RepID=A0A2I2Z4I3_GORGO
MGISRDNWQKRRKTGGKRKPYHKKRKYELERPAANTKIGPRRIHTVHVQGKCCTRKTKIIDVVYNASNNELIRTKTLVKNCIMSHYVLPLGRKMGAKLTPEEEEILNKKKKNAKISSLLEEQFQQGKLLACIASRLGQYGYVLEGKELEFYLRKIKARKGK